MEILEINFRKFINRESDHREDFSGRLASQNSETCLEEQIELLKSLDVLFQRGLYQLGLVDKITQCSSISD